MTRAYTYWTTSELKRLAAIYPVTSRAELMAQFAPRTVGSIMGQVAAMDLRKQKKTRERLTRDWKAICANYQPVFFHGGRASA